MSKATSFTIGADPEFFLYDRIRNRHVPVCGLLGGTKKNPQPLLNLGKGFSYQEDNVMAEFNVPPAREVGAFYNNIRSAMTAIIDLLRGRGHNVEASGQCEVLFPMTELSAFEQALEFGCSPDFNAWDMGEPFAKPDPESLREGLGQWRFAGGHIHLGYDRTDIPHFVLAQFCDLHMGLPSLALDGQKKRRALYGSPGRFRPTSYGIEYRTLSNYWLFSTSALSTLFNGIDLIRYLVTGMSATEIQGIYKRVPWEDVKRAMTTADVALADDLVTYYREELSQ